MPAGKACYKVVFLGASGTGKTSIIEQTLYGNHVVGMNLPPTLEDTYSANVLTERNSLEQFRFYDTAGLDCQKPAVPKHYYTVGDAFVLVFDITRWETFHCVNALKADIDKNSSKKDKDSPVVLAFGNKIDLENSSRQIDSETVTKWAVREKVHFREVTVTNKSGLMDAFVWLSSRLTQTPQRAGLSIKHRFKKESSSLAFAATGPAADL
ncbi:NF-kappa-B inhibitor-interacting Ras-like protein 1 [Watersipora subatra]|uniref:NF-kappa-B inhibitor-interacting Ras-like protein 1 n=1 Tax=Watersipora subatra TaxID=2589382 RepID=UPI00355B680D